MWRPGFAFEETAKASLDRYRRCFCIYSVHHRGTAARPGLVLGLDRGGHCDGLAFRVAEKSATATMRYLRTREQVNGVYRETVVAVTLEDGRKVSAITYLAERAHPSYAGNLDLYRQAALIRAAHGLSGSNIEYLRNTLTHMHALSIRDVAIERICVVVGSLFTRVHERVDRTQTRGGSLHYLLSQHRPLAPLLQPTARKTFIHRQSN